MSIIHVCAETTNTKISDLAQSNIQPDAVDLSLGRIYTYAHNSSYFELTEDTKVKRELVEIPTESGFYTLTSGYYMVEFDHLVTVGEDEAGFVVPRSTLMRNGVLIHSCLYDSGYHGKMIAGMTVNPGCVFRVKKGTRLAQYLCFKAQAEHQYSGQYQEAK